MAIRRGTVIMLEVKTDTGVVSELQQYMIDKLNNMGIFARVVRDVSDVDVFCYKLQ
jgi:hypothetical protein